jgi:hypothetical protein
MSPPRRAGRARPPVFAPRRRPLARPGGVQSFAACGGAWSACGHPTAGLGPQVGTFATRAPYRPLRPGARAKRLTDGRKRGAHRQHAAGAALRPLSSLAGELSRGRAKPLPRLRPRNCARLREPPPAAGRRARRAARWAARGAAAARRGTLEAQDASNRCVGEFFGTYKGTTRVEERIPAAFLRRPPGRRQLSWTAFRCAREAPA